MTSALRSSNEASGGAARCAAFLFIDVDGYCAGGIDQREIVSRVADGYRARELGWAYYAAGSGAAGSLYFRDRAVPPLATPGREQSSALVSSSPRPYPRLRDPAILYAQRLHGLPIAPGEEAYGETDSVLDSEIVLCSSQLLEAFRLLHDAVARATGLPVVFVHKGGNEGLWVSQAVPGATVLELGSLGCPRVDVIGKAHPELHLGRQCAYHAPAKRRARKIVHCPRLEVELLAWWVAYESHESSGLAPHPL